MTLTRKGSSLGRHLHFIGGKPIKRSGKRLIPHLRAKTDPQRTKRKRSNKGAPKSISKLIKEADALMSRKVRYSNLDENGLATCFTCGHKSEPKKMQNGHYLSRYYKAARWHPDNTRNQCFLCNIYKKGDPIVFRQNLIKEIGEARVLAVEAKRSAPIKLTREFLETKIRQLTSIQEESI